MLSESQEINENSETDANLLEIENFLLKKHLDRLKHLNDDIKYDGKTNKKVALKSAKMPNSLTLQQKHRALATEYEQYLRDCKQELKDLNKSILLTRAESRAVDMKMSVLKKEAFDFKRYVMDRKVSKQGNCLSNIEEFMRNDVKHKQSILSKLTVREEGLKSNLRNLKRKLIIMESNVDTLTMVDLEQLQIENSEFSNKIAEKNRELFKLKQTATTLVMRLNKVSQQVEDEQKKNLMLTDENNKRSAMTEKLTAEKDVIGNEIRKLKSETTTLEAVLAVNSSVPTVEEYIRITKNLRELKKKKKDLVRKTELKMIAKKS